MPNITVQHDMFSNNLSKASLRCIDEIFNGRQDNDSIKSILQDAFDSVFDENWTISIEPSKQNRSIVNIAIKHSIDENNSRQFNASLNILNNEIKFTSNALKLGNTDNIYKEFLENLIDVTNTNNLTDSLQELVDYANEVANGCNIKIVCSSSEYGRCEETIDLDHQLLYENEYGEKIYQIGTEMTINAIANEHYKFKNWSNSRTTLSNNPEYKFIVDGNQTIIANFEKEKYNIVVAANNSHYLFINGGGLFEYGQTVKISAKPTTGYVFAGWVEGTEIGEDPTFVSTESTYSFIATKDVVMTAVFEEASLPIDEQNNEPSNEPSNEPGDEQNNEQNIDTTDEQQGKQSDNPVNLSPTNEDIDNDAMGEGGE